MLAIGIGIAENAGQEGFKSCNGHWKGYCLEEAGRLYQQQAASDRSAGAEGGCVQVFVGFRWEHVLGTIFGITQERVVGFQSMAAPFIFDRKKTKD